MKKFKNLQIDNLNKKFKSFKIIDNPKDGWIRTIRNSLSMPLGFLANKLKISPQAVSGLEKSEIDETITLKSLRMIAEAMDCRLHYILVPQEKSLNKIIEKQAYLKALEIVKETDKTMSLEGQKVDNIQKSINSLAKELASNPNNKLWND